MRELRVGYGFSSRDDVRHADDGSNAKVFPPATEKARNHPNLHLLRFTASPALPTARLCISQVSFSFLGCPKSDFFLGLNFVTISFVLKNHFGAVSGNTHLRPLFLCFSLFVFVCLCFSLFVFVFHCFSLLFFVFLCFSLFIFVFLCFLGALGLPGGLEALNPRFMVSPSNRVSVSCASM